MSARPIFGIVSLVLIAGSALLIFLVLLAGAINVFPINQIYFLQAETAAIPGAQPITRWTLWNLCGDSNGNNFNCTSITAANPFDPQSNFNGTQDHVPQLFIGDQQYYYQSRVVFAFLLIALFFNVCALFVGVLALCSRIGAYSSSAIAIIALLMQSVTVGLMTSCYVMGQNIFNNAGMPASIGKEAFGFLWASWACLLISAVLFCVGGSVGRHSDRGGSLWSRGGKKSNRDRGSFGHDAETSSFVRS